MVQYTLMLDVKWRPPGGGAAQHVDKIGKVVAFLQDMAGEDELRAFPSWKPHQLGGDRKGAWSRSVTRNWRITFRVDRARGEIYDLDYEDYH